MGKYDIAAYIWPAYTGKENRTTVFWPQGIGEWQSVIKAEKRCDRHILPRKPVWGTVDEADPEVMEYQISEALKYNVNVFIYDWYWYDRRPFLENCLNDGFLGAGNNEEMKFFLMWANHDAEYLWDKRISDRRGTIWLGSQPKEEFDKICRRVIDKYFTRPNYYKIDGCPVFSIYHVMNLIEGLGGIENTRKALDGFRADVKAAGFPDLHLQMVIWSEGAVDVSGVDGNRKGSTRDIVRLLGFDSVTHYQFVHFTNCNRDYAEIVEDVKKEWQRIDREYDVPYYPHVSVGWDNNPRYNSLREPIITGNDPETVGKAFLAAKEYVDSHDQVPLITVNSWNEWTEMSYLEPDDVYGYGYLEQIRKIFGQN